MSWHGEAHHEVGAALRIASGVLARDADVPAMLPALQVRPGDPAYYADVIARQLDGRGATAAELILAVVITPGSLPRRREAFAIWTARAPTARIVGVNAGRPDVVHRRELRANVDRGGMILL